MHLNYQTACLLFTFFSSLLSALDKTKDKQPTFGKQSESPNCCKLCHKIPEAAHSLMHVRFALRCTDICYSNSTGADYLAFQQTLRMARGSRAWRKSKSSVALLLSSFSTLLANSRAIRHNSKGAGVLLCPCRQFPAHQVGSFHCFQAHQVTVGFNILGFLSQSHSLRSQVIKNEYIPASTSNII